jgi:hypothetical protein
MRKPKKKKLRLIMKSKFNLELRLINDESYVLNGISVKEFLNSDVLLETKNWEKIQPLIFGKNYYDASSSYLKAQIYIDNKPLMYPYLRDEHAIDLFALEKSLQINNQELLIFNCTCGIPRDAGIINGIKIYYQENNIKWEFDTPLVLKQSDNKSKEYYWEADLKGQKREFYFNIIDYKNEIINTIKDYNELVIRLKEIINLNLEYEMIREGGVTWHLWYFNSPLRQITTEALLGK